ncbi:unnamed protein product [Staurois parvus]|uniref:Uncharacterized protein n=1 Tax=Staurois parvus TaxID=386267 RepID=A0ABN9EMR8_9NEOB|nr:unnamed protein product [Staurois parvus]
MQTTSTNICERIGLLSGSSVNSSFGCHLCNKSIYDIPLLLNITLSTISGIITKRKRLGTTAIQLLMVLHQSGSH